MTHSVNKDLDFLQHIEKHYEALNYIDIIVAELYLNDDETQISDTNQILVGIYLQNKNNRWRELLINRMSDFSIILHDFLARVLVCILGDETEKYSMKQSCSLALLFGGHNAGEFLQEWLNVPENAKEMEPIIDAIEDILR